MSVPLEEREYEVEAIRDRRFRNGRLEYLVKWVGYPEAATTWTDSANLNCPECLEAFLRERRRKLRERAMAKAKAECPPSPPQFTVEIIRHEIRSDTISFEIIHADGSKEWLTFDEAKHTAMTPMLNYLESIAAFPIRA
jgi:hypothetical protein